jgi:hypothetical protein
MSAAVRQRARIARVRRLQHGLAASSAAAAVGQLRSLEVSRERLALMRRELAAREGATSGAALSAAGELAMRLEAAGLGLVPSIEAARAAAAAREQARLVARREQESAERLEQAAAAAAGEVADRKLNRVARRRRAAVQP